ncbi:U3 small nucleolar RNA-associated protein 14 -like protein A [Toxocara canis]|uniref:U3 small nucleolar RNA-associated protein 14-like protein A n=1 Tax=Toxocara canis TaxID=6265 RepID=A0A0B2UW12_TOXCA|nr:U3 small nucleolar RNA-associated protein 14 -like protein A [Toxocara canis]
MSNADSDYDRVAHAKLLKSIQAIGKRDIKRGNLVNKKVKKVSTNELINAIHSTRNLDDVKKKVPKKKKVGKKEETMTLSAPLHRLATERIQSNVAYTEAKRELAVWTPVVRENRLADQLIFPIEKEEFIDQIGIQSLENLKPRTPLEVQMASIIGTSKSNLHNEQSYTEAEVELLKAMSLKEAKANCARLRKMRALMSNREAKLRRQAKIKSKSYHRRLKRQKRRQLIKEFDELLAKDPEAAKEKLAEIEHQRILERATLKHRNGSKRIQMLARHASKDTNIKRALEEQIRFGRELVQKHGVESGCDSDSDNGQPDGDSAIKPQQLLERAAEIVVREETFETSESCRVLKMSLSKLRAEQKLLSEKSAANAQQTLQEPQSASSIVNVRQEVQTGSTKLWEEDTTYHRRLKRQKRRQLIKEFDELLAKDPEAAKEKLAEIEHQRILERATLKHRNGSKRIQMLARHASKDTNIKRALEEQIRFGRELVQKHGVESGCDSDSDNGQPDGDSAIKPQQLLERAAEIVVREETFETSESCRVLKMSLSKLRAEQKLLSEKSAANAQQTLQEPQSASSIVNVRQEVQTGSTKLWEEDTTWDTAQGCVTTSKGQPQENTNSARVEGHTGEDSAQPLGKRKSHTFEKKKKKKKMKSNETSADVEELFTNFEQRLIESTCKEAELIRSAVMSDGRPPDDSITPDKDQMEDCASGQADDVEAAGSMCAVRAVIKKAEEDEEKVPEEVDISLDPRHFLKAETGAITQISADIMDRVNEFDAEAEQEVLVAAAFEDDDVIGDFEAEKAAFEEREKPKDLDLNLQGWGSWAGPGIAPKKKNRRVKVGFTETSETYAVMNSAGSMCAVRAVIKKAEEDEEKVPEEVDISLDPRHFLKAETGAITQISADIMDRVNEFDAEAEQEVLVAAAFEDDDVIGDFEAEKAAFEEREKPKDLDLNLQGWGSWAGPGIAPKKKNRFIIKAKGNKRKDRGRHGLIISEAVDSSIDKIQPRSAGRIIKPLDKEETLKGHIKDASDEES